jgi:hypothetical protein
VSDVDTKPCARCAHCLMRPVAYDGARFCGAACSQSEEAGICGDVCGAAVCTRAPRHSQFVKHSDGRREW